MKLCRFDNDRLGVVTGDAAKGWQVHDITDIQTQIRAAHPYATYADAVIAALPSWRGKMEEAGAKARATRCFTCTPMAVEVCPASAASTCGRTRSLFPIFTK